MRLFQRKITQKVGLPPGTLVHIGERKTKEVRISAIQYGKDHYQEHGDVTVEECAKLQENGAITWFNICGIHDVRVIEEFGKTFNIHPLLLEDIVHTGQRPKMEEFDDYLFVVLKMLVYDDKENEVLSEQVSLVLGKDFVISFQESEGDVFNTVRERIRTDKGRIRKMGCDYLAYRLIDAIVDQYFVILEKFGEQTEFLQEAVLSAPSPEILEAIQETKREVIFLRRYVWPLREAISGLQRGESDLVSDSVQIYLRDVYDHTIQVIDSIETFRDMISGTMDVYLSSVSNKMNEVMKVLTIMATIFIPLTFIAGVYGMNFEYMPELKWRAGYFIVWIVMIILGILMLIGFKRKKWL